MAYYESAKTGEREYVFGKGGGDKLAEELNVPLLGRIPLKQPDWDKDQFAPSVYDENHPIGEIYQDIAKKNRCKNVCAGIKGEPGFQIPAFPLFTFFGCVFCCFFQLIFELLFVKRTRKCFVNNLF